MEAQRPVVTLSPVARMMYDVLAKAADHRGFVSFEQCLEISIGKIDQKKQVDAARELQRELLIFHSPDDSGWYLRLPIRHVQDEDDLQ